MMTGISAVNFNANKPHFGGKGGQPTLQKAVKKLVNGSGASYSLTTRGGKTIVTIEDTRRGKLEIPVEGGKLSSKAESQIRNHTAHH